MIRHKKKVMVFGVFLLIILFVFIIILMVHVKKTDAVVFSDVLSCSYREKVSVDRFIRKLDGTLLDNYWVDTSTVGKKKLEIQYKNRYGFIEQKKFEIEVKDVVAPIIVVNNPYTVVEGEVSDLLDVIFCADDYDDGVKCVISGEYDLNRIGQYHLKIEAQDKSGNEAEKEFTLNVVKKEKKSNSSQVKYTDFKDFYQKYNDSSVEIGLDISKWQGEVDYAKIANEGVSFVMLKVGGQTEIGGEYIVDPSFDDNIEGALENGLKVGVYFYSYAKSEIEAKKQARWVVQKVKDYELALPIAFDWENWARYSTFGIGFRTLNKVAESFIEEVKRYHYEGILYSSKYYLENIWHQDDYVKWLAYYNEYNEIEDDYFLWQVCNDGKINGINGSVDIDILKVR